MTVVEGWFGQTELYGESILQRENIHPKTLQLLVQNISMNRTADLVYVTPTGEW